MTDPRSNVFDMDGVRAITLCRPYGLSLFHVSALRAAATIAGVK